MLVDRKFQDCILVNGMSFEADIAIRAAKNRNIWGRLNALAYVRNREVSHKLYRLACQLEAMKKAGE